MIVQKDVFTEDTLCNTEEIIKKFFPNAKFIGDEEIYLKDNFTEIYKNYKGKFRGSMEFARLIGREDELKNAAIENWPKEVKERWINRNSKRVELGGIEGLEEIKWPAFIREAGGAKEIASKVYTKEEWIKEKEFCVKNKGVKRNLLCIVSEPKEILREIRYIIVEGEVVGRSQYKEAGQEKLCRLDEKTDDFPAVVQEIINKLNQPITTVLDIGEIIENHTKKYEVIELNCFETASFYKADLERIYKKWSQRLPTKKLENSLE